MESVRSESVTGMILPEGVTEEDLEEVEAVIERIFCLLKNYG